MRSRRRKVRPVLGALIGTLTLTLSACGIADKNSGGGDGSLSIAVLAASSQNGYNQAVYEGVREASAASGRQIKVKLLDGQFNSNTQLSQMQNAATSGGFSGVIVVPNDGVSLAAAFPLSRDIPVVSVLNPIGPKIDTMTPQVEGVRSTVATPPSHAAAKQAEDVAKYCAKIDPCKVVPIVGSLSTTLDVARDKAYRQVLKGHSNIQVIATAEGGYDRDKSLTAISNVLQAHRDVNAIVTTGDQMTAGAQIALQNAGIKPASVYLSGAGGTKGAIKAVRDGTWKAAYINFPKSMGKIATKQLLAAIDGKQVQAVVDADAAGGGVEPYATAKTLAATPNFSGEWNG